MCAAPCAAVVLAWWVARRSGGPSLFPPQRSRAVPWSGFEVFVVYFLYYFFWVFALNSLLEASGFLTWLYHTPAPALTTENLENPAIRLALNRRMLWAEALAVPFNLATALMFPARMCGTRPYQLGLTRWRCGLTLVAGCLVWLMLTPCVEGVQFVTVWAYMQFTSTQPEPHPLVTLIQTGQVLPAEWAVLTFITVLGAPVLEEVVFRGVIQRWAGSHTTAGNLTMVAAACIAAWARPWPTGLCSGDGASLRFHRAFVVALAATSRRSARHFCHGAVLWRGPLFCLAKSSTTHRSRFRARLARLPHAKPRGPDAGAWAIQCSDHDRPRLPGAQLTSR